MALPTISFENAAPSTKPLSNQGTALEARAQELRRILSSGLAAASFSEWLEYWNEGERLETFADLFKSFRRTVRVLPEEVRQLRHQEAQQTLAKGFPDHLRQLEGIVAVQASITEVLRSDLSLPLRSIDLKAADAECIFSFNSAQTWWTIAMNSLLMLAEAKQRAEDFGTGEPLCSDLIEFTFDVALDALHAASAGAQLRVISSDTIHLTFHAEVTPTDDGLGFLGTCLELDLMTCGETEEEMSQLLSDLIRSFVRSEEAQGTLHRYVAAHLKFPGEFAINQLVIRLDILCRDGISAQFVIIDDLAHAA
jgi:hypothetical protein